MPRLSYARVGLTELAHLRRRAVLVQGQTPDRVVPRLRDVQYLRSAIGYRAGKQPRAEVRAVVHTFSSGLSTRPFGLIPFDNSVSSLPDGARRYTTPVWSVIPVCP